MPGCPKQRERAGLRAGSHDDDSGNSDGSRHSPGSACTSGLVLSALHTLSPRLLQTTDGVAAAPAITTGNHSHLLRAYQVPGGRGPFCTDTASSGEAGPLAGNTLLLPALSRGPDMSPLFRCHRQTDRPTDSQSSGPVFLWLTPHLGPPVPKGNTIFTAVCRGPPAGARGRGERWPSRLGLREGRTPAQTQTDGGTRSGERGPRQSY